jgi:DNA-directed RNA polymerase subunit beta'
VQVAHGTEVAVGDVLAAAEDDREPLISTIAGKVEVNKKSISVVPVGKSVVRYEIPGFKQLTVKDGEVVEAGQRLTNGSVNLHELMRLKGVEATQRYIMNEILRIFASQGQNIADKHLEIIVRQMFSRVQIEDAGDSKLVTAVSFECLAAALVLDREGHRMLAARAGRRAVVAESVLSGLRRLEVA